MTLLDTIQNARLSGATRLDLSCGLTHFPEEIYALADTLEILNLSGNALTSLPDDLLRLHRLRVIFCSDNRFTHLPEVLGRCPNLEMVGFKTNQICHLSADSLPVNLRWLILTDNQLTSLPPELGRCTKLQKLMLAGNQLQHLPIEMVACRNLELLRISANCFESLPDWLLSLPRLAWLAFAGNPFAQGCEVVTQLPVKLIEWNRLALQHKLGEGASGIIHQATWQCEDEIPVAVKLFKGALTSDGLPASEKAACIAAGIHPNLISVHGKISGHPDGTLGLVMPLVDASFRNLASPPSLDSCTRDIYPVDAKFSLDTVLAIAQGIAAAAGHLHEQGILHGDLYAHNILWDGQIDCLLGDFGAASFISDERVSHALERIEVRAFSCLLEELTDRCEDRSMTADLLALQQRCAQSDIAARPSFSRIVEILAQLSEKNQS